MLRLLVTKGTVLVNAPKEVAYDALLAACKDAGAKVSQASRESFTIDGESGTMWLQNRFSYRFRAQLYDKQGGTLLEAHDFSPLKMDKKFLGKL